MSTQTFAERGHKFFAEPFGAYNVAAANFANGSGSTAVSAGTILEVMRARWRVLAGLDRWSPTITSGRDLSKPMQAVGGFFAMCARCGEVSVPPAVSVARVPGSGVVRGPGFAGPHAAGGNPGHGAWSVSRSTSCCASSVPPT